MWFLLRDSFRARDLGIGDPGRIPGGNIPESPYTFNSIRNSAPAADTPVEITTYDPSGTVADQVDVTPGSAWTSTGLTLDLNDLSGTADQAGQVSQEYVMRLDQSLYRYESAILATQESVLDDLEAPAQPAIDLNGEPRRDNQMGNIIGAINTAQDFHVERQVTESVEGAPIILLPMLEGSGSVLDDLGHTSVLDDLGDFRPVIP